MTCQHRLGGFDDSVLVCDRGDDCDGTHRYAATHGADLGDEKHRHATGDEQ